MKKHSSQSKILVIGGGPKAAAIAALAAAAYRHQKGVPEIIIVEQYDIASSWTGRWGFTDGEFLLGTAPEKDVGFPYEPLAESLSIRARADVTRVLHTVRGMFSWQAFLTRDALTETFMASPGQSPVPPYAAKRAIPKYSEWVDAGRPPPPHWIWGAYVEWVVASAVESVQSGQKRIRLKYGRVDRIEQTDRDGRFRVFIRPGGDQCSDGPVERVDNVDGIVVTGPGEPFRLPSAEGSIVPPDSPVVDGRSYWTSPIFQHRLSEMLRHGRAARVAIVGSGETGGSALVDLIRKYRRLQHEAANCGRLRISIVNPDGMIYTRGQSYFENRWYSGRTGWGDRNHAARKDFVRRTDRGVLSPEIMREINEYRDLEIYPLVVGEFAPDTSTGQIVLRPNGYSASQPNGGEAWVEEAALTRFDAAIDATGFDGLAFRDLLSWALKDKLGVADLPPAHAATDRATRARVVSAAFDLGAKLDPHLSVTVGTTSGIPTRLHLPGLAGPFYGPGYANLSCLGLLAQRILLPAAELCP